MSCRPSFLHAVAPPPPPLLLSSAPPAAVTDPELHAHRLSRAPPLPSSTPSSALAAGRAARALHPPPERNTRSSPPALPQARSRRGTSRAAHHGRAPPMPSIQSMTWGPGCELGKKMGLPVGWRGGRGRTNARRHDPNRQKRCPKWVVPLGMPLLGEVHTRRKNERCYSGRRRTLAPI